jgi:DNA-binding NarL/FixJ family response regulator
VSPDDLHPRQRLVVLYLWSGMTPKEVASVMKVKVTSVRSTMHDIANRLPGRTNPLQKIALWKAEYLAHRMQQTIIGLPKNIG